MEARRDRPTRCGVSALFSAALGVRARLRLRALAGALGVILALATAAVAEDPTRESAIHIGRLHYDGGGDWYSNPSSMPNWMRVFQQRTGIVTHHEEVVVRPGDDAMYRYPIVYMNGHGTVNFSDEEARFLREWMLNGGFLWADDNYGMDRSFRREVKKIFPDRELVELPNDHEIYTCFYTLPGLPKVHEHDKKPPQSLVVTDRGRIVLLYTYESDIGDGLEDPDVHRDPPERREAAMRMAINVLYYALTH
ncbi:MAG: DUF4159 domain-containing protein [Candidatus Latescibacterota bacterium]|nr:MAG: DUF4159 domain-containing protein [Candidatus Latescibacterota bacterium]